MIKLKKIFLEFREDLMKQCVVLMGLPASGKSTFINNEVHRYIPSFTGYKVSASDVQVAAAQYQHAKNQYNWMVDNIKSKEDLNKFINNSKYMDNDNKEIKMPITYEWWESNNNKGLGYFYKTFYKNFYATYFDIRDAAQTLTTKMFDTKIVEAGDLLIIDTTAAHSTSIIQKLVKTKQNDFNNTIIYLDINVNLAIKRDTWRKENQGRGVGEHVILGYVSQMDKAYADYKNEGQKADGVVDRLMHFEWEPSGSSPIKGNWKLIDDYKFFLKRKLKHDKT